MRRRSAIVILLSLVSVAVRSGSPQLSDAGKLVGTWRLVEYVDVIAGNTLHQFGEKPIGIFIYSPSGYVSVHVLHNPPPTKLDDLTLPNWEQDQLDTASYTGYFGTFRVDTRRSVVTHYVEGGTVLGYIGTAQERPYRFEGNRLIIGDGKTFRRVLERIPDKPRSD